MKDKIISKAKEMFLKLGFKSITMDDIACEMCISKKTIYKYFSSKEELVSECVNYLWIHFEQQTEEISKLTIDPLAKIILLYELGLQELIQKLHYHTKSIGKQTELITHHNRMLKVNR